MTGAREAFAALDVPWQLAMEEAWISWTSGSAGVGAVISDDAGRIVSRGRNRMGDDRTEPGVLANTAVAHAEMNALAALPLGPTDRLTITTTFEPCLMCAASIVQSRIPVVRYAGVDPLFTGLHDWFADFGFTRERLPRRDALGGPIAAFGHVLHVSWLTFWMSQGDAIDAHGRLRPRELEVARSATGDGGLAEVAAEGGDVVAALEALWPALVDIAL